MATSILFPGSTAGPALAADPTGYTFGVQISVSQNCRLNAVRFFSPTGAAVLPQTIGVYQVTGAGTGTLVHSESATWSGAAGSGWVRAKFSAPPALATATQYKVVVLQNAAVNWYGSTSHYWDTTGAGASGITSGIIFAPQSSAADVGQCSFFTGGTLTYPNSTFNASNYYVSPEVATEKYNTGVTFSGGALLNTQAFTGTVPAGVLTGDVLLASVTNFTYQGSSPAYSAPTSGGGAWTQIGTIATSTDGGSGLVVYSTLWYRVATAADAGSTFSISYTGTVGTTNGFYWAVCLEAYTGFYTASPIGNTGQAIGTTAGVSTLACPSLTTSRDGSWAVYSCPSTVAGSGSITAGPAITTQRHLLNPGNGVDNAVFDSEGAAGDAGSAVGGGNFTFSSSPDWATVFTVELCTVASSGVNVNGAVAAVAVAAPAGSESVSVTAGPAAVAVASFSGTESVSLTGPVAGVAVAAPIGQARGLVAAKGGLFLAHII